MLLAEPEVVLEVAPLLRELSVEVHFDCHLQWLLLFREWLFFGEWVLLLGEWLFLLLFFGSMLADVGHDLFQLSNGFLRLPQLALDLLLLQVPLMLQGLEG